MIGKAACEAILKKALRLSTSEATDVYLLVQEPALTRFADNLIHQNVSHNNAQLHVRAVVGRRQGRATTTTSATTASPGPSSRPTTMPG